MKHKICLITGNKKKLQEFQQILGDDVHLENQNVDLPELQGDAEEIVKQKVMKAYKELGRACITEDTSLCFGAYKGLPGPYIKWFMNSVGVEGLTKMVEPFNDKSGYAMCIIGYMAPDLVEPVLFIGKTLGNIVQPKGSRDFGWDPVFQPEGFTETYAELPKQTKNRISHRYRAIDQMKKYFKDKPILGGGKDEPNPEQQKKLKESKFDRKNKKLQSKLTGSKIVK